MAIKLINRTCVDLKAACARKICQFFVLTIGIFNSCISQTRNPNWVNPFIPNKTDLFLHSTLYVNFEAPGEKGVLGGLIKELRLQAFVDFQHHTRLIIKNETYIEPERFVNDIIYGKQIKNRFNEIRLNYYNTITIPRDSLWLAHGITFDLDVGRIEWLPRFSSPQLILANIPLYLYPKQFWGAAVQVSIPLLKNKDVEISLRGHTGDLFKRERLRPTLEDAYITAKRFTDFKLGVEVQIGRALGYSHVINYAHITFSPLFEKVQCNIKLGKLPTFDESPYGIHFGISRKFKYLSIGGFYEKRLRESKNYKNAGIYWRLIGPPKLARFIRNYNINFSFNNNAAVAFIPLAQATIHHK